MSHHLCVLPQVVAASRCVQIMYRATQCPRRARFIAAEASRESWTGLRADGASLVRCPDFTAFASWRASLAGGLATWLDHLTRRVGQTLVRCPEFVAFASWRASLAGGLEEGAWLDHLTRQSGAEQAVSSEIIPQRSRHYQPADQLQASNLVFFIFLFLFFRLFQVM